MKPIFIAFVLIFTTFACNTHAVALDALLNELQSSDSETTNNTEQKNTNNQDTSAQDAKTATPADEQKANDNLQVLGSESTKLTSQHKNKIAKDKAAAEADMAISQAKQALSVKQQTKAKQSRESLAVVEQLVNAYNARNIEEFIRLYDENVEFYIYPNELLFKGKEKLIARYGLMFKKLKCLHSSPIKRIVHGDIVIDHELSETCSTDENVIDKRSELISSYQIKNGKVVRVLFFR